MKNKTKIQLGLVCGLLMSNLAQADLLFTVGTKASLWSATPKGQLDEGVSVDSKDGLNLKSSKALQLSVFFEHPVPFLPNVQVKRTNLKTTGEGTLSASFNEQVFSESVSSKLDLSHTDLTLYWGLPIPLPLLDVNFGLTGRQFNGDASVKGELSGRETQVDINATLPMLYGSVKVGTPIGIYAKGDVNYVGLKDNKILDYEALVGYDLPVPVVDLGVELGYRALSVKTDKDTLKIATDTNVSGAYFGVSAAFGF